MPVSRAKKSKQQKICASAGSASTAGSSEVIQFDHADVTRSVDWTAIQWAQYLEVQKARLHMLRIQDVATKMAVHINTVRNLYDPDNAGYDPEFPTPVKLTNAANARAVGFIAWEIDAYLVLQIARCRGIEVPALRHEQREAQGTVGGIQPTKPQYESSQMQSKGQTAPEPTADSIGRVRAPSDPAARAIQITSLPTWKAIQAVPTRSL